MNDATTIGDRLQAALSAYGELVELAEDIEDEWGFVTDLSTAWGDRLRSVIDARGSEAIGGPERAAIMRAADEISRITDPHRAIDWLSTFPQIVLVTLGEQP